MNDKRSILSILRLVPVVAWLAFGAGGIAAAAQPQLPDFVYQGQLQRNGAPADGTFDLGFALYDAASGGNQVGVAVDEPGFPVDDGLFTVSLAFPGVFDGTQLWLQVSVEGVPLQPRQPIATTPVAQYALSGTSGPAGGDLAGSYPNPSIRSAAVTTGKIATGAVTADRIAGGAVTAGKIASGAVQNSSIAGSAVTLAKTAGGFSNGNISLNIGANACIDGDVGVNGTQPGDMAVFNVQAGASLPQKILITPLKVATAGTVTLRICNLAAAAQSFTNLPILLKTFR